MWRDLRIGKQHFALINLFHFFYLFAEKILSQTEKQRYDGYYNNLAHPEWGAVGEYKQSWPAMGLEVNRREKRDSNWR